MPAVLVTTLFFLLTFNLAYRAFQRRPSTGSESLVGAEGKAMTHITRDGGSVALHGEVWSAFSDELIKKGDKIEVIALSGLQIKVKKKEVV